MDRVENHAVALFAAYDEHNRSSMSQDSLGC